MAGMVQGVWDSIFEGGVNSTLHRLMNLSFYGLFATLAVLALMTRGNVHVIVLLVLSVALFAAVNWCVALLTGSSASCTALSRTSLRTRIVCITGYGIRFSSSRRA